MRTFWIALVCFTVGILGYAYSKNPTGCMTVLHDFADIYSSITPVHVGAPSTPNIPGGAAANNTVVSPTAYTPAAAAPVATPTVAPTVADTPPPQPTPTPTPVAITCTIIQSAPIEAYGPDGSMTSVSQATVGASFQYLRTEDGKAVLKDANGNIFKIEADAVSQTSH